MNTVSQAVQGFGSTRIVVLSVVGIALLIAFTILSLKLTSPVFSPLYSNLSSEDSGVIATELGSMGIDFEMKNGGAEIHVPSSDVLRIRMALAQKGIPSQGSLVGYEIFDKEDTLGTSSFVHNVNLVRALEGELSRTISSLSSIKSARVHLVIPKKEIFKKRSLEPSASVVLSLTNRVKTPKEQIEAVKHLVTSAIPGLKSSKVTIVDSRGHLLAKGSSEGEGEDNEIFSASTSEEYRTNYESKLKRRIETLLEQAVGAGNVEARISAEIGFDRKVTNSETFDPDGRVARSIQTSESNEQSSDSAGGTVSVANNLPDGGSNAGAGGSSNSNLRTDEVTNFEISKTITNHISETGKVQKISVAVLVDGTYETIENEDGDEENIYKPRSDEEIEQIRMLVSSAIGYNAKRGDKVEIINMQFNRSATHLMPEEGAFDWIKQDLDSILKTLVVGIVAILAILLVIRPLVNRAFEATPSDLDDTNQMGLSATGAGSLENIQINESDMFGNDDIDIDIIQSKVDTSPARKINELINNNPDETLTIIRSWLNKS